MEVVPHWYIDRLNAEYQQVARDAAATYPPGTSELSVEQRREFTTARMLLARPATPEGVTWEDLSATVVNRNEVPIRIYRHSDSVGAPTYVYIHGGGMWNGSIENDHAKVAQHCADLRWNVITIDYRRAPEFPHPIPMQDCITVYLWLLENGAAYSLDTQRIVLGGLSAGGGLALATALWLRDNSKPLPNLLMLQCPMVDDRSCTDSIKEFDGLGPLFWDKTKNEEAWAWYLGGKPADGYSSPLRMKDLSGLPPTFIDVGHLDPFLDEDVELARRLREAGVETEIHTYKGLGHATEYLVPDASLSQTIQINRMNAMKRVTG